MKFNKRYIIVLVLLLIIGCAKKDKNVSDPKPDSVAALTVLLNTQNGAALKYKETFIATKDSLEALIGMSKWIIEQPDVAEAYIVDDCIVEIVFKSGLKSKIVIVKTDANGTRISRGGNINLKSNSMNAENQRFGLMGSGLLDDKLIGKGNTKALVFIPYYQEFYKSVYPFMSRFDNGKQKLEVTLITGDNADLGVINSFANYGFIILNTHGLKNGFGILPKVEKLKIPAQPDGFAFTEEEVKQTFLEANNLPLDKLENGELELCLDIIRNFDGSILLRGNFILVTENYIRKIPNLTDAVVFGNYCYSGYTADGPAKNNMSEAFRSIGAISYFGYAFDDGNSEAVFSDLAITAEDTLITSLVKSLDLTGVAHLKNNTTRMYQDPSGTARSLILVTKDLTVQKYKQIPVNLTNLYFKHFLDPMYKYGCGSFTDPRDGNIYNLACIGKQTWMAENLRYNAPGSVFYRDSAVLGPIYGKLYDWYTVMNGDDSSSANPSGVQGICPSGWHLPSASEWQNLINAVGHDIYGLKDKTLWINSNNLNTDIYGFSARGGGWWQGTYQQLNLFSQFQSSELRPTGSVIAYTMQSATNTFDPYAATTLKKLSCRCLKD